MKILFATAHCATLLLLFSVAVAIQTTAEFEPGEWEEAGSLDEGRVLSTVVFGNQSLFVVGGCLDTNCSNKSSVITHYNPRTQLVERSTELHQGIAGMRSTVTLEGGVANGIYLCHMCSLMMPGEEFNRTLRSTIGKIDFDTGHYNATFLQLLKGGARANASCVTYGYSLYIIGGLVEAENDPDHLVITNSIAKYDFFNDIFDPTWYSHPTRVMDAAVAKDSSGFYVSGGLEAEGENNLRLSRLIKAYYPDYDCRRELSTDTDNGVPPMIKSPDFAFIMWAQMLIFVAPHRDVFYTRPFGISRVDQKWATYNMSAHVPPGEQNLLRGHLSSVDFVPMLDVDGANDTSASLVLFQFGGFEMVTLHNPLVPNATVQVRTLQKSILKTVTNIRTPGPILGDQDVKQYFKWSLNVSGLGLHTGCEKTKACMVALAVSPACESPHASDTDAVPWDPENPIVNFLPRGTSDTVYLCFSYGNMDRTCESGPQRVKPVEQVYYPTNLFHPYTVVLASTPAPTPVPTNAPNGSNRDHHSPPPTTQVPNLAPASTSNMLVYVLAAIAGVTTILAICLVARLRRVPDEGILAGGAGGASTTGPQFSQQEDRYKTVAKIGEGAFSAVYLVIRRKDGKRFAMKHMECQSDSARQDAIKECEIMRTLQGHPNVISLVDMFMNYEFDAAGSEPPSNNTSAQAEGGGNQPLLDRDRPPPAKRSRHLCLVMEYHASGDLKRWLSQFAGHPSEAILCSISFQIVSVLVHIHNQEPPVIHRDLKPENLLINQNAAPSLTFLPIVVTDFGLARLQEESHCKQGAGTLPYVAPECFRKNYTTQCDMWSLGCVLYALATKRVTHDKVRLMFEDCRLKNFESVIRADLQALGYHSEFTNFVLLLLQVDPNKRLTASGAFKLFRRRGEMIYLTSRISSLMPQSGGTGQAKKEHEPRSGSQVHETALPPTTPVAVPCSSPAHTVVPIDALPESSMPGQDKVNALMEEPTPLLPGETRSPDQQSSPPLRRGSSSAGSRLGHSVLSSLPRTPESRSPPQGDRLEPSPFGSSVPKPSDGSTQVTTPSSTDDGPTVVGNRNSQGGEDPQSASYVS